MNILEGFTIKLFEENEYKKLDNFIKIKEKEGLGYFFDNIYYFNNDFAYSKLLMMDIKSYRNLIFDNCYIRINENKNATFLVNYREACRCKKILLTILLIKYSTLEEVRNAIIKSLM